MPDLDTNLLYYDDNLSILREYIPEESVDLVYLDSPFDSNRQAEKVQESPGQERMAL